MKSLLQNICIFIYVTWQFQKCGLRDFRFNICQIRPLTKKQPSKKRNSLILMVQTKFRQKLWSHFFTKSTFWSQSRDHLKHVECSTSSLIFDKFDFLTNKHPTKGTILYQWFKSNLSISYEVTSSKFLHFDISHVTIPKLGLENFQFNIH